MNMIKFLAHNWIGSAAYAALFAAVVYLSVEVNDLKSKLATTQSQDAAAAAQLAKFERDLFARWNAEKVQMANAIAKAQAQQNAAAQQELKSLPTGVFGPPPRFPTPTPHE